VLFSFNHLIPYKTVLLWSQLFNFVPYHNLGRILKSQAGNLAAVAGIINHPGKYSPF
jgi:hypothetical protein